MTDFFLTQTGLLTMNGATGILVSLGIEYAPDMSLATAYMLYNYVAVCILFFIAAMSGARSESRFLIILPIIGAILFWFGWIHAPDQVTFLAFLVITMLLGIFSYMNDVNHEKYGMSGPGSKLLNIVMFIIVFQAAVGVINGWSMFPAGNAQPTPNACQVGYTCDEFGNINLQESVGTVSNTGGLFQSAVSLVAALPLLAISILKLIVSIIASVIIFAPVLNATIEGIVPGISSNAIYVGFLALMQVGIWGLYLMTIYTWWYKPMPGEGTI